MFIGDSIGDSYKDWQPGATVFISSQTGSGKTSFILNELLPFAKAQGKRILYLVNRRVLKEQMEHDISKFPVELRQWITVELYQTIENKILNLNKIVYEPERQLGFKDALRLYVPEKNQQLILNQQYQYYGYQYFMDGYKFMNKYKKYGYVVCDECHYFLMDSNYNTNTIMSYKFVKDFFYDKIRVYMSATINEIRQYIMKDEENDNTYRTFWHGYKYLPMNKMFYKPNHINYDQTVEYDYVDVKVIYDLKELATLIVNGVEKWLVFVDNKEFGNKLKKQISDISSSEEKDVSVSFVTADYELNDDTRYEVNKITEQNKQVSKVLIATSVLDNGINLKDMELRNIAIIADTKTEFLQMLGRKRKDGNRLNLYIYQNDRNHFQRRHRITDRRKQLAENIYRKFMEEMYSKVQQDALEVYVNCVEDDFIRSCHKQILHKLMNLQMRFEDVKALFLSADGIFRLNMLSFQNVDNLEQYYFYMIEQFEEYGEDAFLYEQLRWLNKSEEEIDLILRNEKESYYDKCCKELTRALTECIGKEIPTEEFIMFKKQYMTELKVLVEHVGPNNSEYTTYKKSARSNERPISDKFMNFLRENCGIPFSVESKSGIYKVKKVDE